jgi:ABC-type transporter Mla subunit MlaD
MEFVGQLNNELARAGRLRIELTSSAGGESKIAEAKREREALASRIREIITQLDSTEARLERAQQRVTRLSGRESALNARVAALTARLDSLRTNAEAEQRSLSARIAGLEQTVVTLSTDTARLAARVASLSDSAHTVYYVAATEQELLERGIIVREGGRRYLFAGPRTIQPARRLSPEAFNAIDMTKTRTIQLPPGQYRILSRHSVDLAKPGMLEGGKVGGTLRVTTPEEFWAGSRYLILVKA